MAESDVVTGRKGKESNRDYSRRWHAVHDGRASWIPLKRFSVDEAWERTGLPDTGVLSDQNWT